MRSSESGKITKIVVTQPGAGYSSPPKATVEGYEKIRLEAKIKFEKDLKKNGGVDFGRFATRRTCRQKTIAAARERRAHRKDLSFCSKSPLTVATREFSPGFRLSCVDVVVLALGAGGTILVAPTLPWLGIAIAFTVGHFFLFCNVIRMDRSLELVWAAIFAVLAASTILTGFPAWPATLGVSFLATVILVALQTRKPSYHGIFWRRINPRLPQWWETNAPLERAD